MRVKTDFETKHFIEFTRLNNGILEILACNSNEYTVQYNSDKYSISHEAMQKIKLLNQNLIFRSKITQ